MEHAPIDSALVSIDLYLFRAAAKTSCGWKDLWFLHSASKYRSDAMSMRPMLNFFLQPLAIVCMLLVACASESVGHKDLLDFLNIGATRREEVLLKLGEPSAQYEDSRILAYRLGKDDEGGYILLAGRGSWAGVQYSLILVFDENGILRRHSAVEVRRP